MPITQKKRAKGLPKRTYNAVRKAKYQKYALRSTCAACQLVFRTPALRQAHDLSGHTTKVGVRKR